MYSGNGITLDGAGCRNFGNDFAKNIVTFRVDNSLSSYADSRKSRKSRKFLVLGEGPPYGINGSFGSPGKN